MFFFIFKGECEDEDIINEEDIKDENDGANKKVPSNQQYVKGLYKQSQREKQNQYSLSVCSSSQINQSNSQIHQLNTPSLIQSFSNGPDIQSSKKYKISQISSEVDQQRQSLTHKRNEKDHSLNKRSSLMIPMNNSLKQLGNLDSPKRIKQLTSRQSQMFLNMDQRNINFGGFFPNLSEYQHLDKEQMKQQLNLFRQSSRMILSTNGEEKRDTLKSMKRQSSKMIPSTRNIEEPSLDTSFFRMQKQTSKNKLNSSDTSHKKILQTEHQKQLSILLGVETKQGESLKRFPQKNDFAYDVETKEEQVLLHIFGELKFAFDKVKEYQIFYPQYNYTNVVRRIRRKQITNNPTKVPTSKKKQKN